jgi:hypothetical protein
MAKHIIREGKMDELKCFVVPVNPGNTLANLYGNWSSASIITGNQQLKQEFLALS